MNAARLAAVGALTLSALAWMVAAPAKVAATAEVRGRQAPDVDLRAFVSTYCAGCHNDRLRTGGLSLANPELADPASHPELWEKVLHKMRTGQMPPARQPRPDPASLQPRSSAHVTTTLDRAAAARPDPGRVGAHRLNRTEYGNAIRDLLGVDIDANALLLPDEADEGFDNVAASLALSPAHLERYLTAAREISRLAVGDRVARRRRALGDLSRAATAGAGRARERRSAVRIARWPRRPPQLSAGRRIRVQGSPAPPGLRLHRRHGPRAAARSAHRWQARQALHRRRRSAQARPGR